MENIFETVTIEQFKAYFYRDFPFLPLYDITKTYWIDDIVFEDDIFYKSLIDNNTEELTNTDAWQPVKGNVFDYVTDCDIEKAKTQAIVNANARFGDTDQERINIYMHLIAYYLVVDLRNSSTGINGSYQGPTQSKSVGDVSESYAIPTWLTNSPMYSMFAQNGYGLKYLSLIAPYLACTLLFSRGGSTCG